MAESVRVLFIGAGAVNFGGAEGPWDHSKRLERLENVRIVGIADPDTTKAEEVRKKKKANQTYAKVYEECEVYSDYRDAIKACKPDVAFIGIPPFCHGGITPPLDIELQCLKEGLHLFVEKPISVLPPEEFLPYVDALEAVQKDKGLVVSVGYMFRYHPAVEKMKSLLESYRKKPLAISARYNCAYSEMTHPFWWNKAQSGGPIVEQATHFCDLLRYLGGEVRDQTVSALSVDASDEPGCVGYLSSIRDVVREKEVPPSLRVPRLTTAHWHFAMGGVGTLTHGITIQGRKYETAIEVWADGLRMYLEEPYFPECKLRVRDASSDMEQVYPFPDADPYKEEVECFLRAVSSRDPTQVRSSYRDASRTYKLSWDIRRASENSKQTA